MKCVCCLSSRITDRPLGLNGKLCCLDCGLIFETDAEKEDIRESDIYHFKNVDPHLKVAKSKTSLYNLALNYLSSKVDRKKKSLLDVGCGFGYFLELAEKRGWQISGVEIVGSAVAGARAKLGTQYIFHGTLKEAKYPDNSFDVITSWDVLFHVSNPFQELKECFRVLKKRGIILIRVRNVGFEKMAYRVYWLIKKAVPNLGIKSPYVFHRYCFSSNSMSRLLSRLGFANIQITNSPLTMGDPYGNTKVEILVKAAKGLFGLTSRITFLISNGKWIIGPSLLVWAEKP